MARPGTEPTWGTDTNYTNGPNPGTATKATPSSGFRAEGWLPQGKPPAQYFNWWQNLVGQWIAWLASGEHDQPLTRTLTGTGRFLVLSWTYSTVGVRVYVSGGANTLDLVTNARWDSATSKWVQDAGGVRSNMIRIGVGPFTGFEGIRAYYRQSGTASWSDDVVTTTAGDGWVSGGSHSGNSTKAWGSATYTSSVQNGPNYGLSCTSATSTNFNFTFNEYFDANGSGGGGFASGANYEVTASLQWGSSGTILNYVAHVHSLTATGFSVSVMNATSGALVNPTTSAGVYGVCVTVHGRGT